MYRIREVDGRDPEIAADLQALQEATFGSSAPFVSTDVGHWWLTHHGDDPVAFAALVPSWRGSDQGAPAIHAGYLVRVGVLPEHRGHGLQRRLIRVREARARKNGWTRLVTDTFDNPASANSLIGAGFKLFEPKKPWSFKNALYWHKEI